MTRTRTSPVLNLTRRPAPMLQHSSARPDDLLEEVRQLRAALAVYRKLVERLLLERESRN